MTIRCGRYPGSMPAIRCMLRSTRLPPATSATESATCATTQPLCKLPRPPPPCADSFKRERRNCSQGKPRGRKTEQEDGRQRHRGSEGQHPWSRIAASARVTVCHRREIRRPEAIHGASSKPERRTSRGEQQAFGEQLLQQCGASRSECQPDRHLAAARRGASQQQTRHVAARNHQHQDHCHAKSMPAGRARWRDSRRSGPLPLPRGRCARDWFRDIALPNRGRSPSALPRRFPASRPV